MHEWLDLTRWNIAPRTASARGHFSRKSSRAGLFEAHDSRIAWLLGREYWPSGQTQYSGGYSVFSVHVYGTQRYSRIVGRFLVSNLRRSLSIALMRSQPPSIPALFTAFA